MLLPTLPLLLLATLAPPTHAALCRATGLLGLGSTSPSYPGQFYLRARSAENVVRTIITSPLPDSEGFYPLVLGAVNTQISSPSVPKFTLGANRAVVPVSGAGGETVLVTKAAGLLTPEPLYLAPAGQGVEAKVQTVDVVCDEISRDVLRFTDSPLGVLGSGSTNVTFAAGAAVTGPVLGGLLTFGAPMDLLMLPFTT